jgi:hypothetical protein
MNYLCARGTVAHGLASNTAGIYKVEGLETKKGSYPLLIKSISWGKRDLLLPVACLNGVKVIYSFGPGFGEVVVRGEILLGPLAGGAGGTQNLQGLIDWFEAHRVSKSRRPVKLSIVQQGAVKAYLNTLQIAEPNQEFQTQMFAMGGVLVE